MEHPLIKLLRGTTSHWSVLWLVAIVAALLSIIATVTWLVDASLAARDKLRASRDAAFNAAMSSNDLQTIGSYLFATLGQFTIAEYSARSVIRDRVDQMMSKLRTFVGTTDDVNAHLKDLFDVTVPAVAAIPVELEDARHQLDVGAQWNALATLRRDIEILLRNIARGCGIDVSNRMSAGQLAMALRRHGAISINTEALLRSAIAVANRAVHGLDVSAEEAERAIRAAATALDQVKQESQSA